MLKYVRIFEMEGGEEREAGKTQRSGAWIINKDNV